MLTNCLTDKDRLDHFAKSQWIR